MPELDDRPALRTSTQRDPALAACRARWRSPPWAPPRCCESDPTTSGARALLADAVTVIGSPAQWPRTGRWPEPRLRYANAVLPEVLLAAGSLLGDDQALADGLAHARAGCCDIETADDHLSVTPVGGWALGEPRPGFDQQPIEVAALADACARAYDDHRRPAVADRRAALAQRWFLGENDAAWSAVRPVSGGGCDGLERDGRNENQGAESTLAMISTFQQAHRCSRRRMTRCADALASAADRPSCGADPGRVIAKLFLPGQEMLTHGISPRRRGDRAGAGHERGRGVEHAGATRWPGSPTGTPISRPRSPRTSRWSRTGCRPRPRCQPTRRQLIGAYFTQEYSVEAAALFNPSMVAHPDQTGLAAG